MNLDPGVRSRVEGAFVIPELNVALERPKQVDPAELIMHTFIRHREAMAKTNDLFSEVCNLTSGTAHNIEEFSAALALCLTTRLYDNMDKLEEIVRGARLQAVVLCDTRAISQRDKRGSRYVAEAQGVIRTDGFRPFRAVRSKGFHMFAGILGGQNMSLHLLITVVNRSLSCIP